MEEAAGFLELLGPGAQAHLSWSPAGVCAPLLISTPAAQASRRVCLERAVGGLGPHSS